MSETNNEIGYEEDFVGLSDEGMTSLCSDIQSYAEKISKSLNDIDDLVDGSISFYDDDTRNVFVNKKTNFKVSKNNIVNNVASFVDEYNNVVSSYKKRDSLVTSDISLKIDNKEEK